MMCLTIAPEQQPPPRYSHQTHCDLHAAFGIIQQQVEMVRETWFVKPHSPLHESQEAQTPLASPGSCLGQTQCAPFLLLQPCALRRHCLVPSLELWVLLPLSSEILETEPWVARAGTCPHSPPTVLWVTEQLHMHPAVPFDRWRHLHDCNHLSGHMLQVHSRRCARSGARVAYRCRCQSSREAPGKRASWVAGASLSPFAPRDLHHLSQCGK